jgi:phenylacetate-CoA ligase
LYKREVLADVLEDRAHYKYFQHFITIAATARRYKIVQVPVTFDERFSGESFIESPLMFSIEAAMDIPRALWEYRINRRKKAVKG